MFGAGVLGMAGGVGRAGHRGELVAKDARLKSRVVIAKVGRGMRGQGSGA
jgi:hypothetical protein